MNRPTVLVVVFVATACLPIIRAQSLQPNNVETFMQAKLEHSKKVLEGLTTEDYELIARNAQAMSLLSQATAWQVLQTPDYMRRSVEFRDSAEKLKDAAKERNLDGATLAYVDVTMKCVECHKYVRRVQNARNDRLPLPGFDARTIKLGAVIVPFWVK